MKTKSWNVNKMVSDLIENNLNSILRKEIFRWTLVAGRIDKRSGRLESLITFR